MHAGGGDVSQFFQPTDLKNKSNVLNYIFKHINSTFLQLYGGPLGDLVVLRWLAPNCGNVSAGFDAALCTACISTVRCSETELNKRSVSTV